MPATPPTSEGIVLRPFRDADVGMLRDLATDPYVPLIGSLPANASEQDALDFIERQQNRLETGVGYSFCVAELASDTALGTAGLWIAASCERPSDGRPHRGPLRQASRGRGQGAPGGDGVWLDAFRSVPYRAVRRTPERRLGSNS